MTIFSVYLGAVQQKAPGKIHALRGNRTPGGSSLDISAEMATTQVTTTPLMLINNDISGYQRCKQAGVHPDSVAMPIVPDILRCGAATTYVFRVPSARTSESDYIFKHSLSSS